MFSRSTEGHNQDKASMGPSVARDLRPIGELADHMLAISVLAAAQATDASGSAAELPPPLRALHTTIRDTCPATVEDRRHDELITRRLASFRAGQLPV